VTARRQFLLECGKAAAAFMFMAACEQEKLLRPKGRPITPDFFGHMVQGEWVLDDGTLARPVTVYFGVLRLWDSRAVWWKMVNDPAALDANLRYAESVGADAMFVFGEAPQDALVVGRSKMPTREAWLSFVKEIARQRIRYVELWNEPAEGYWDGSPEELAEYCRLAYPILAASGKTVCSPSFTSWNASRGYEFFDRFLAAGGGEWCDEIAFHAYTESAGSLAGDIASLRELLKKHRVSRPIRNTEYNIVPSDPSLRSAYMAQSLLIQASLGVAGAVWDPETVEAANDYTDGTMRRVAEMLLGSTVGPITSAGGVSRCVVSRGGVDTELCWTRSGFPSLTLKAAA
jgi:hypothetical protein